MACTGYGGVIRMNPEIENINPISNEGYPFEIPKVYLEGTGVTYFPQNIFSFDDDSVVVVREKSIVKYTKTSFAELLVKNENGDVVWLDARNVPCSDRWYGVYLNEERGAWEYKVEEYDLETFKKRKYKVVIEETTDLDYWDYRSLSKFVEEDNLGDYSKMKDSLPIKTVVEDNNTDINESSNISGFRF